MNQIPVVISVTLAENDVIGLGRVRVRIKRTGKDEGGKSDDQVIHGRDGEAAIDLKEGLC